MFHQKSYGQIFYTLTPSPAPRDMHKAFSTFGAATVVLAIADVVIPHIPLLVVLHVLVSQHFNSTHPNRLDEKSWSDHMQSEISVEHSLR